MLIKESVWPMPNSSIQQVSIPSDAVQLEGDLTVPQNAVGVVLFAHGSGSSRLSPRNQFVAEALRNAGIGHADLECRPVGNRSLTGTRLAGAQFRQFGLEYDIAALKSAAAS